MPANIQGAWRRFLIDLEFAKNYPFARVGIDHMGFRNPILEQILPSLLHIKAVAILDGALKDLLAARSLTVPRKYGNGLKARINYLADEGIIVNPEPLHEVRDRRNDVAHEFSENVDWQILDKDVGAIQEALETLSIIGPRPVLGFKAERSAARDSTQVGVLAHYDYRFYLEHNGKMAAEVRWTENLMKDDGD